MDIFVAELSLNDAFYPSSQQKTTRAWRNKMKTKTLIYALSEADWRIFHFKSDLAFTRRSIWILKVRLSTQMIRHESLLETITWRKVSHPTLKKGRKIYCYFVVIRINSALLWRHFFIYFSFPRQIAFPQLLRISALN